MLRVVMCAVCVGSSVTRERPKIDACEGLQKLLRTKFFFVVPEEHSRQSKRNTNCDVTVEHRFGLERGKSPSQISPQTPKKSWKRIAVA